MSSEMSIKKIHLLENVVECYKDPNKVAKFPKTNRRDILATINDMKKGLKDEGDQSNFIYREACKTLEIDNDKEFTDFEKKSAIYAIIIDNYTYKQACENFGIPERSLRRYINELFLPPLYAIDEFKLSESVTTKSIIHIRNVIKNASISNDIIENIIEKIMFKKKGIESYLTTNEESFSSSYRNQFAEHGEPCSRPTQKIIIKDAIHKKGEVLFKKGEETNNNYLKKKRSKLKESNPSQSTIKRILNNGAIMQNIIKKAKNNDVEKERLKEFYKEYKSDKDKWKTSKVDYLRLIFRLLGGKNGSQKNKTDLQTEIEPLILSAGEIANDDVNNDDIGDNDSDDVDIDDASDNDTNNK
jgi:hypothetical protein